MKKSFILTVVLTLSVALQAQRFEWVKAYSSPGGSDPEIPANIIKGSVVDRDGNIYVLGEYFPSATAMPFGVYPVPTNLGVTLTQVNSSIVIAKLNPDGELLWYKGLHSVRSGSSGSGSLYSRGIKLLGDTAIMVCAYVYFPFENYRHDELYYLDTLLVDDDSRFGEIKTANDLFCCFMTLSLDGRLIEDHILEWCAADGNGEPIRYADTNYIETGHVQTSMFDVDSDGNIYLYNMADQYFYRNPTATKLGFVIDRRHIVFYRDDLNEGLWNWEIVKFSPHFDTVLKAIYVFDSTHTSSGSGINATSFRFDKDNNLYLGLYQEGGPSRLPLGNSDTLVLTYNNQTEYGNCLLIKYDTNLVPLWAKQTHSSPQSGYRRAFHSRTVEFDYATNSIYLTGWSSKRAFTDPDGNADISLFYDNDTLDLDNNFFWLRLDRDNGRLISYGKVRSDIATLGEVRDVEPRIVVANGKVAAMFNYVQAVSFADTTIDQAERQANGAYGRFTALAIWDEDGNELALHDLNAMGSYNRPGAVYAHDSILYITCSLTNGATFGDIEVPSSGGRSQAILAKYVNPIFSTGGGQTPGGEGIDSPHSLTQSNNQAITIFPNPTTGILHIKPNTNALAQSSNLTITSLTIHNAMGQPVATNTITQSNNQTITLDLSPLPAGVYYLTVRSGETTARHKIIKVN